MIYLVVCNVYWTCSQVDSCSATRLLCLYITGFIYLTRPSFCCNVQKQQNFLQKGVAKCCCHVVKRIYRTQFAPHQPHQSPVTAAANRLETLLSVFCKTHFVNQWLQRKLILLNQWLQRWARTNPQYLQHLLASPAIGWLWNLSSYSLLLCEPNFARVATGAGTFLWVYRLYIYQEPIYRIRSDAQTQHTHLLARWQLADCGICAPAFTLWSILCQGGN